MGCVYCATNTVNGKKYIGKTVKNLEWRINGHLRDALERNSKYPFHAAIRLYGKEQISWEILYDGLNHQDLIDQEIKIIAEFKKNNHELYNLTDGGDGLLNPSAETRKKIGLKLKGVPLTKEHKDKIKLANTGKIFSDEHKKKYRII